MIKSNAEIAFSLFLSFICNSKCNVSYFTLLLIKFMARTESPDLPLSLARTSKTSLFNPFLLIHWDLSEVDKFIFLLFGLKCAVLVI